MVVAVFSKLFSFGKFAHKTVWGAESENTSSSVLPTGLPFDSLNIGCGSFTGFLIGYLCVFFTGTQFTQLYKGG